MVVPKSISILHVILLHPTVQQYSTIVISTQSLLALGVLWVIARYALCYASAPAPPDLPSPSSPPPPVKELTKPRLTRQEQSDPVIISQYLGVCVAL